MVLTPPKPGSYTYNREIDGDRESRTEEYETNVKRDDHSVLVREFVFADFQVINVEAWARSGVHWVQTRIPGVTTDWCVWDAKNRPRVLPGDLAARQVLRIDSTCTVKTGERITMSGTVEVLGPAERPEFRGTRLSTAKVNLELTYRGPARTATIETDWQSWISPDEGLTYYTEGSFRAGSRGTVFTDTLSR